MRHIQISSITDFDRLERVEISAPGIRRRTQQWGSSPTDIGAGSVNLGGSVRHVYIHDVHNVGWWSGHPSVGLMGGEMYDVTVTNVGWAAPDRGHGHGLYTQNYGAHTRKTVDSCVFVAGFSTAGKVYQETTEDKISGYTFRNCIFVGSEFLVGGRRAGARDITFEDCVFVNCNLHLGYIGRNFDLTARRCVIFGNLVVEKVDGLILEDIDIIVRPPYRRQGVTAGEGAFGIRLAGEPHNTRMQVRDVKVYTDSPDSAFNGWTRAAAAQRGGITAPVAVEPLSALPARQWAFPIPEARAANLVVWNPERHAEIALPAPVMIRDVRRWHTSAAVRCILPMSGDPDAPLNWDAPQKPPVPSSTFPELGVFRLEEPQEHEGMPNLSTVLAGAGLSSPLATASRRSWEPTVVPGLFARYDASSIVALSDGDPVSQWDDLSGGARHVTQSNPLRRPTWHTNVRAGKPAVRFDTAGRWLSGVTAGILQVRGLMAIVINIPNYTTGQTYYAARLGGTMAAQFFRVGTSFVGEMNGGTRTHTTPPTGWSVWLLYNTPTNTVLRLNGALYATAGVGSARTIAEINVGARPTDAAFFGGEIAEVLHYVRPGADEFTTTEITAIEMYLKEKWGV